MVRKRRIETGSCEDRSLGLRAVISLWHSHLFGDNRPQTGPYLRCRALPMRYVLREIPADGDKPAIKTSAFETIGNSPEARL